MPKYKNEFKRPSLYDHEIVKEDGTKLGTLRVKPTGVAWKRKSAQKFSTISLDEFTAWIEENGKKTKS